MTTGAEGGGSSSEEAAAPAPKGPWGKKSFAAVLRSQGSPAAAALPASSKPAATGVPSSPVSSSERREDHGAVAEGEGEG